MTQPDAQKRLPSAGMFVSLSSSDAIRAVCAALALATLVALFRIVSIW